MDLNEINDRVARGADLLSEKRPGWYDLINLDTLDISSVADCVLGQTYGDYGSGLIKLGVRAKGGAHGFLCEPTAHEECTCNGLEAAWTARITALRHEYVQQMLSYGWVLSRDSLALISPSTGREISVEPLSKEQLQALLND